MLSVIISNAQPKPYQSGYFCQVPASYVSKSILYDSVHIKANVLFKAGENLGDFSKGTTAPFVGKINGLYNGAFSTYRVTPSSISKTLSSNVFFAYEGPWSNNQGGGIGVIRILNDTVNGSASVVYNASDANLPTTKARDLSTVNLVQNFGFRSIDLGYINFTTGQNRGQIFAVENFVLNNADVFKLSGDSADFTVPSGASAFAGKNIKKYQNSGWVVEVDRLSADLSCPTCGIVKKHYDLGRLDRSGLVANSRRNGTNDGLLQTTVQVTDGLPSVIIKTTNNSGLISFFAYKESEEAFVLLNESSSGGSIIALTENQLLNLKDLALQKGATMYNKLTSIAQNPETGFIYIAEEGGNVTSSVFSDTLIKFNGELALHLQTLDSKDGADGKFKDPHGRILVLNQDDEIVSVFLEGGKSSIPNRAFSNPSSLYAQSFEYQDEKGDFQRASFLVVSENITVNDDGQNPAGITNREDMFNELFFLNLGITSPTVNDMKTFAILPPGVQSTMTMNPASFSPLLVAIQNGKQSNSAPYNDVALVAFDGFEKFFVNPSLCDNVGVLSLTKDDSQFIAYPNPANSKVNFNKTYDISLYDMTGALVKTTKNTDYLNIEGLKQGFYFVRNELGQSLKLYIYE